MTQFLISKALIELSKTQDHEDKIVCSHTIYKALITTMPELDKAIKEDDKYEVHKYGLFTIEDFIRLAKKNRELFKKFDVYTEEEMKQQKVKELKESFWTVGNLIQYVPPNFLITLFSMYKMIRRYRFLKTIAQNSAKMAFKLAFMRKQLISVITLYKILMLLMSLPSEAKEFFEMSPSDKTRF